MTIMMQSNSEGTRRCDGTCHRARKPKCSCICGGRYHGAGEQAQERLTQDWLGEDWREKKAELEAAGVSFPDAIARALELARVQLELPAVS